jgi:phospholipid/cholesterol/gamma-HCH transport system permease protein
VNNTAILDFDRSQDGFLVICHKGTWKLQTQLPPANEAERRMGDDSSLKGIAFDTRDLMDWDSGFLTFLIRIMKYAREHQIPVRQDGLPEGVQRLLKLAFAVPERRAAEVTGDSFLPGVGGFVVGLWKSVLDVFAFIGETALAFLKIFAGKARFRVSDLFLILQECGIEALPIVSLISLLVGLILAFVGSIQLSMFGAQIYIANLVGIAMVRAMGAIMAGIIMAGRTGASFAARIGTMQVNEEIDALKTSGISPVEFLVLPRVIALAVMMPLLTLYADLMGVLGGMIVGVGGFDISFREYLNQTQAAITLTNIWIGVFSGFVFGILIAFAGCLRGMQCGRSASAVGDATTSAVVTSIVSIIVATAIITVLCNVLGI